MLSIYFLQVYARKKKMTFMAITIEFIIINSLTDFNEMRKGIVNISMM